MKVKLIGERSGTNVVSVKTYLYYHKVRQDEMSSVNKATGIRRIHEDVTEISVDRLQDVVGSHYPGLI